MPQRVLRKYLAFAFSGCTTAPQQRAAGAQCDICIQPPLANSRHPDL